MKKRVFKLLRVNLILILSLLIYYFINKYTGFYIPCVYRKLTGLKCPGCGVTRCIFAIINLNFKEAINQNILICIYLPFLFLYYIYKSYIYIYDKKDKVITKIPNWFFICIIIITLLYGVLRNFY